MQELIELFEARRRARQVPHAVATVLRVDGSSYRRPGARMLVNIHGRVAGSVSGGCLERAVVARAQAALLDGKARLLSFDTTDQDDLALGASMGCEGKIWIGVEVLPVGITWRLEEIVQEVRLRREPVALLTQVQEANGEVRFCSTTATVDSVGSLDATVRDQVSEAVRARKTRFVGAMPGGCLIEWLAPPVALLLFGAGPDVLPMLKLALNLGHEVTIMDRRPDFALPESFPGAHRVLAAKPGEVASHFRPDAQTVAVLMNHHYETDRDVLAALLPLDLPYLALLGPKRRTQRMLAELRAEGHRIDELNQATLHGPAGLDIGAGTPEQIALSILAEIHATLAGREGGKLRDRLAPIHAEQVSPDYPACASPA